MWAAAELRHRDILYGVVVFSTLKEPERDIEMFDRILETFEFVE